MFSFFPNARAESVLTARLEQIATTIVLSGCWESNPVYTNPNRAYYRYTTARREEQNENATYSHFFRTLGLHGIQPVDGHPSKKAAEKPDSFHHVTKKVHYCLRAISSVG